MRRGYGADFVRLRRGRLDVLLVDGFDDDCRDVLRADGMLVANPHTAHPEFEPHVALIERAFDGDALFVSDVECSNTLAFAGKRLRQGVVRPGVPRLAGPLDRQAWGELMPAFAHVADAPPDQANKS